MNIVFNGTYKSITPFSWNDIPDLAIITGLNGVGKTQILQIIGEHYNSFSNNSDFPLNHPSQLCIFENVDPTIRGIVQWSSQGATFQLEYYKFHYSDLVKMVKMVLSMIHPNNNPNPSDPYNPFKPVLEEQDHSAAINRFWTTIVHKKEKIITYIENQCQKSRLNLSAEEIAFYLPEHILLEDYDIFTSDSIEMLFYLYAYRKVVATNEGKSIADIGIPPWEILNEVLETSNIPYRVNQPDEGDIKSIIRNSLNELTSKAFSLKLIDPLTGTDIGFNNLSSGEKVLMSLALLLYYSQKRGITKKLMILDEPDAHLHPSMTLQYFDVIYKVLIQQYGVKVIMSTHSPSTIALAPEVEGCGIFEMKKNPTQIIKSSSRSDTILLLTEGLILISPLTKYILIEGIDDKPFYEAIYRQLLSEKKIEKKISLAFIYGNGLNSVNHWSKGLREAGLSKLINGVIDKDNGNVISDGIYRLERYSIENYLIDPIIVAVTCYKPSMSLIKFDVMSGEEEKIKYLTNIQLQEIADEIIGKVEKNIPILLEEEKQLAEINFINGKILSYPKWLLKRRGKDLLPIFQRTFAKEGKLNHPFLIQTIKRTLLIPSELEDLFIQLQK